MVSEPKVMLLDMLERLVMVLGVKNGCWMDFWMKNRENSEQSPSQTRNAARPMHQVAARSMN